MKDTASKANWRELAEPLFSVIVVGVLGFVVCPFIIADVRQHNEISSASIAIESWSVANPAHSLSSQEVFSLEEFSETSGNDYSFSHKYNVVRTSPDELCFIPESKSSRTYAFTSGEVFTGNDICGK